MKKIFPGYRINATSSIPPKNYIHLIASLLVFSIIISCDKPMVDDCETYDFSDCELEEPEWGLVYVDVTINDENPKVPLVFYIGNIEENVIEWIDTAYYESYEIEMPLNEYYSVTATYKSGSKAILALDGERFETKKYHICDENCWVIRGGEYDLRLKY